MNFNKDDIYYNIATLFGSGKIKYAPGTIGSLFGLFFVCVFHHMTIIYSGFFIMTFVAGLISSDKVEKQLGVKDPKEIIIDEFACIFAIFFFIPKELMTIPLILTAFVLYRVLDIFKIPPVNLFEKLKGGFGIMLDDLVCALITGTILRMLISFRIFVK